MKKPKFKVGDIVTVVANLSDPVRFGVNDTMKALSEREVTIVKVLENAYPPHIEEEDGCKYKIQEDDERWSWSSPMFVQHIDPKEDIKEGIDSFYNKIKEVGEDKFFSPSCKWLLSHFKESKDLRKAVAVLAFTYALGWVNHKRNKQTLTLGKTSKV